MSRIRNTGAFQNQHYGTCEEILEDEIEKIAHFLLRQRQHVVHNKRATALNGPPAPVLLARLGRAHAPVQQAQHHRHQVSSMFRFDVCGLLAEGKGEQLGLELLLVDEAEEVVLVAGLAIKNPPKKPTKNGFLVFGFFKFLIFYENNTNFSL